MYVAEKINIYVPDEIAISLEQDMQTFEIFKANRIEYNWNRFLSMLLRGYFDIYLRENGAYYDKIISILNSVPMEEAQRIETARAIVYETLWREQKEEKSYKTRHLSIKTTKGTEDIIQRIIGQGKESISRFCFRMFISYFRKPLIQRERIVFHENYTKLLDYCKAQQPITITTIWDQETIFEVVPYAIAPGTEEIHNYLLCQTMNRKTGEKKAQSFALHRIKSINISAEKWKIDPEVEEHLLMMKKMGPAYAINDDDVIKVRLNNAGIKLYRRIYFGRPKYERVEYIPDGQLQYYRCSMDQAFLYFKRFDPMDVEIISPEPLRERMCRFFQSGYTLYGEKTGR